MKNERTQRDHDIIRQSSLKAAVDLTIGMLPQLEDQTEISDLVLRVAGKFQNWVLNGQSNPVQDKVDGIRDELEQPPPRERQPQERQPAPADPPREDPKDSKERSDALHDLMLATSRDPYKYKKLTEDEWSESNGRYIERGQMLFGASPGDPYPLSAKQFGYLCALHKERTLDTDPRFLLGLSTDGASQLIEYIKDMPKNGNGRRKNSNRGQRRSDMDFL